MQEVFEKIIGKLENKRKTAEQLIMENPHDELDRIQTQTAEDFASAYKDAIEIVKQEAEKFGTDTNVGSNGWIPCSSGRLPEENADVEVTIEEIANDVGGKRYYNVRSWLQDGQWVIKKNPYNPTVIAWKYPTEPYQPKGE